MKSHYPNRIVVEMTGDELRGARSRLRKTQEELAALVGVHWNTIARYERGEIKIPEPLSLLITLLSKRPTRIRLANRAKK